jgi:hypothetical protein
MRIIMQWRRGLLAASAALATLGLAVHANAQYPAQYAPYGAGQPTQYTPAQSPYNTGAQYGAPQNAAGANPYGAAMAQQPVRPQYAAQGAYQGYAPYQAANPSSPYTVPHTAMAFQPAMAAPATTPPPTAGGPESLPLTAPAESVPAGPMQGGAYAPQPTPAAENYGYGAQPTPGYGQQGGYESYPAAGCQTGGCNTGYGAAQGCNATPYGACDTYSTYGSMSGCIGKGAGCGYWFGGAYGLLMDRDNSNKYPLVFAQASMPASSYPTAMPNAVLSTRDADIGFQGGVEFRLGRAFGCGGGNGGCDPCGGCGGCGSCGPRWGLEGVYWTLFEDDATDTYVDQATLRTYTMMPFYGLQYDNGSGVYRPMNEYFDYAPPSQVTNDIEIRLARVRSSLQVQNAEVNLLRLNVCGGGGGPATCTANCGPAACGGDCSGGYGSGCGNGYSVCDAGCGACAPRLPRYSCTGVCGFRWMQFDEDFMFGVDFDNTGGAYPAPIDGSLNYWSTVQNNLFGAQVGCNGMYRVGCKWGLNIGTLVGVYGNDVDVRQYFVSPTNLVNFIGTGENFDTRASKTDVAMIGELRLGVSYQATCHCRLYGGWRAIGITGIALATEQAPSTFISAAQLSNYVNSNGSMILHGLQTGVEWNY